MERSAWKQFGKGKDVGGASMELDPREQLCGRRRERTVIWQKERNEAYDVLRPSSRVELSKSASAMVVSVKGGHNHGEGCDRVFAPETGK